MAVSEKRSRRRVISIIASISIAVTVVAAAVSLQPHDPGLVVVYNSQSVPFTWTLTSNSTANITGSVTSYFQMPNDNATNSTLCFNAEFVPLPNPSANNELFFEFYTNITGNISSVMTIGFQIFISLAIPALAGAIVVLLHCVHMLNHAWRASNPLSHCHDATVVITKVSSQVTSLLRPFNWA